MRRTGPFLLAAAALGACAGALLLPLCPSRARADPGPPPVPVPGAPEGVSGEQMRQLQDFGTQLGEGWLRDTLGLDLPLLGTAVQDSVQRAWDEDGWDDVDQDAGSAPQGLSPGASASAGAPKGVSVRMTQTDGLSHLSEGLRDVPFGAEVRDNFQLGASAPTVHTRLNIPLSPDGTWRAEARMPLQLSATAGSWWWRSLGLGRNVALSSDMSSRLGLNQVEAGMGTDWRPGFWGVWNLDYAFQVRYGQGGNAAVNWLKVSKRF